MVLPLGRFTCPAWSLRWQVDGLVGSGFSRVWLWLRNRLLCLLGSPKFHLVAVIIPHTRAARATAATFIAGWGFRFF